MPNRHQYPTCRCVYLLGFKSTHKVYVGSSIRWPHRKKGHINPLEQGKHPNPYLQRAYDKHAKNGVYFEELEFFDTEIAMRYGEQKWIAFYRSDERSCGFNIVKDALRRGRSGCKLTPEQRAKMCEAQRKARREHPERFENRPRGKPGTYTVYRPDGTSVTFTNLARFCRDESLDERCMRSLVNDKAIECDGWKLTPDRKDPHLVEYDLIGPNNERVKGTCLADFSRSRGLSVASMDHMWQGRIKTCQGWRRFDTSLEKATTHRGKDRVLIDPQGNEVAVNNLKAFCRKHGLSNDTLRKGYPNQGWRIKS